MTSGERIEFSKEQPGRIYKESIIGTDVKVTGELDKAYMKGIEKDKKGKILRIMVSISLSDTEVIMIMDNKFDFTKSLVAIVGIGALVIGFVVLVTSLIWI